MRFLYNCLLFIKRTLSFIRGENDLPRGSMKRILVIELTKLGDLIVSLPLFPALRNFFPQASLWAMVQPSHASLLKLLPHVDGVFASLPSLRFSQFLQTVREIRLKRFDLVVSASPSVRHGLLALLSGARYKCGYLDYSRAKVVHLQSHRVLSIGFSLANRASEGVRSIGKRVEHLTMALGMPTPPQSDAIGFLRPLIEAKKLPSDAQRFIDDQTYVVVHPCASWSYRAWPLSNFRELISRIIDFTSDRVLVIGSEGDRSYLLPLIHEFSEYPRVSFVLGLDLNQLAAVIARSRCFIGNDSGPLHLAAAVGTPIVGLFGPAPPELTGPRVGADSFLYKKLECSPCDQEDCIRKWAPCMTLISLDEVFEKVKQFYLADHESRVRMGA